MTLLFTSDLDRTLIYSMKAMEEHNNGAVANIRPVEWKKDRVISYMHDDVRTALKEVMEHGTFIPVTTRSVEQYQRIAIFQEELAPKYAVTSNGGTILVDGRVNQLWSKKVQNTINEQSVGKAEIRKAFVTAYTEPALVEEFFVDNLFYCFYINREKIDLAMIDEMTYTCQQKGWRVVVHGRKLYLLPNSLSKENAVAELKNFIHPSFHIAAGDTVMDYGMLVEADRGILASHATFKSSSDHVVMTENKGMTASLDIVEVLSESLYSLR